MVLVGSSYRALLRNEPLKFGCCDLVDVQLRLVGQGDGEDLDEDALDGDDAGDFNYASDADAGGDARERNPSRRRAAKPTNPRRSAPARGAAPAGGGGYGGGSDDDDDTSDDEDEDQKRGRGLGGDGASDGEEGEESEESEDDDEEGGGFGEDGSKDGLEMDEEEGEEGEEDEERHAAMLAAVRGGGRAGTRRRAPLLSEAAPESEYNLQPGAASGGSSYK
jgi:hypothetical protein